MSFGRVGQVLRLKYFLSSLPSLPTPGERTQHGPPRDNSAAALPGLGSGSGQHGLCHSEHDSGPLQGSEWPRGHLPVERPGR